MNTTPDGQRLHIVLAGERNSGKSSLLNAVAGQSVSIVSDVPGTTTDKVSRAMEIPGLGPCVFVDTAGLDDSGPLGEKRRQATLNAIRGADIVIRVVDSSTGRVPEIPAVGAPVITVYNKSDIVGQDGPMPISALTGQGIPELIDAIKAAAPAAAAPLMTQDLLESGQLALLVMPQDSEAPKGRLILPQQQVLRELLDRGCRVLCCTTDGLQEAIDSLKEPPAAIVTDSRDFARVRRLAPEGARLSSFSILLAAAKGDIGFFKDSARAIDALTGSSRVLIAEACTHAPASEDIGRVKLPALLRKRAGEGLKVDVVSGADFPVDLRPYDLVIHCGACMFNRALMMSRVRQAREQGVPMTNYGVAIAYINNIIYEDSIIDRS